MALTSLIIPTQDGYKNLQVETIEGDNGCILHWYACDENFEHLGPADASADKRSEEQFHVELREQAAKQGHLVTSHSTNPEWNPEGYVRNLNEDGSDSEGDRAEGGQEQS